jgi:hypothetical protein
VMDETEEWRTGGEDGRTVISGTWSSGGPVVRALCHDAETAAHIVRLHNEARQDGAFTVSLATKDAAL